MSPHELHPTLFTAVIMATILMVIASFKMRKSDFWCWIAIGSSMFITIANFKMERVFWTAAWFLILAMNILYLIYARPWIVAQENKKDAPKV